MDRDRVGLEAALLELVPRVEDRDAETIVAFALARPDTVLP